ncbi:hypothetical protein G647_06484 [Cladophialophora carrionii CBS 160.54]|uniref:Uncharacterized protein n=1 Tax=Cladophialophora carrionii CBS 160.54 TaxID=1279043 RepID=V9D687_9EURO|nr:uncharacterized protein G647_06484 [Cladophialophora carrionii CBS 160.54]ETI22409.1 hypothetical protein G647_06484 [Cladophialophora carrionii CBS 160.54]
MDVSPSTWRLLGLGVSASYIGLGAFAISTPSLCAQAFGLYPTSPAPGSNANPTRSTTKPAAHANTDIANHSQAVETSMVLLGARDLTIGLAVGKLAYDFKLRETGTLLLSGMVLCAVDVYEVFRLRGPKWASVFAVAAGVWLGIGAGLVQS